MAPVVDFVSGATPPKHSLEVFRNLDVDLQGRLLRLGAYRFPRLGVAHILLQHPFQAAVWRREGAILHVDSLLLAYLFAFPFRGPRVVTCHDTVPFLPEYDDPSYASRHRPLDAAYYGLLERGLRRADRIVTDSEFVRSDLVRRGYDGQRIDVVPLGVDLDRYRPPDPSQLPPILEKYGIPRNRAFILFVGAEHPRKNLEGLLRAFSRISEGDPVLVKVGAARHPQRGRLLALARSLGIDDRIRFVDHVAEVDLPLVYAAAQALVLPSFYEGFGLPPLEAMACGTPVAVSNSTSLPEVAGDAAVLFDPHKDADIADALRRILSDRGLRTELRARGLARAQGYSWKHTAMGVRRTYEAALGMAG